MKAKILTQLSEVRPEDVEQLNIEYLGPHDPITPVLSLFVQGELKKGTWD